MPPSGRVPMYAPSRSKGLARCAGLVDLFAAGREDELPVSEGETPVEKARATIVAQTRRWGTDEAASMTSLQALTPAQMAELAQDATAIDALNSELSGADKAAAGAQLARGRDRHGARHPVPRPAAGRHAALGLHGLRQAGPGAHLRGLRGRTRAIPAGGQSHHPVAYREARAGTYYGIRLLVANAVVGYRRTAAGAAADLSGIERLRRLPFGVLTTIGGVHLAMIINGGVNEVHRDRPATDRNTVEAIP